MNVDLFVLPEMPHAFQMFDCEITRAWSAAHDRLDGRSSPDLGADPRCVQRSTQCVGLRRMAPNARSLPLPGFDPLLSHHS